tara:strand:+ start:163 stop:615 length:453 start_codon:yes stop_codon:yes gene_type:complete
MTSTCFTNLPEDIVSLVMTYWSPGYGYMDELKRKQLPEIPYIDELKEDWCEKENRISDGLEIWNGGTDLHSNSRIPVGDTLSQSPCVWKDGRVEQDDEMNEGDVFMLDEEIWYSFFDEWEGAECPVASWYARCSGLLYPKKIREMRALLI